MKIYRFLSLITVITMVLSVSFTSPAQALAEVPETNLGATLPPVVLSPFEQDITPASGTPTDPEDLSYLMVTKTADQEVVQAGDTIGFTVTVTNTSDRELKYVYIYDPYLPETTTWYSDDTVHCGWDGADMTCLFDSLGVGESLTVHITGVATAQMCGTIQNKVWAWEYNRPWIRSNWAYVTILCEPDLQVTKTAEANTINPGERARFLMTVVNNGTGDATGVTLNDPLPNADTLTWEIDPTGAGSLCAIANGVLTCDFGTLAPNETRSVSVSAVVPDAVCDVQIINEVTVTGTNEDEAYLSNNTNSATIHMNCTTLVIEKEADVTGVAPGTEIGFMITVRNTGDFAATNVEVLDQLVDGTTWTEDREECSIDANNLMTCNFPSLAPGQEVEIHVTSTATAELCGTLVNEASVTADGLSQALIATADVFIDCCVDVRVIKRANNATIFTGDRASFTMTVTSAGDDIARGTTLTDPLPANLTWTEDSEFCTITGGVLNCDFGDMYPGTSHQVTVTSAPIDAQNCGGVIVNTATVTALNQHPNEQSGDVLYNDVSTDSIFVGCADFQVTKLASYPVVGAGEVMEFVITVANGTSGSLSNVLLTDALEQGNTWVDNSGHCSISNGTLTCNFGTLAAHTARSVTIRGYATASMCGAQWENIASATATGLGPVYGSDTVTVTCAPDVRVTKYAAPSRVTVGQNARYNLTVSNIGSAEAAAVTLNDPLPNASTMAWTLSGADSTSCSITGGVLSCNFGTLAAGDDRQVTVQAPVTGENCGGSITNTATVSTTSNDANLANNSNNPVGIQLSCNPLQVTKVAEDDTVGVGSPITFIITVSNGGSQAAQNVVLQDELGELTQWTVDNAACQIDGGLMTCNFGEIPANSSVEVRVTGTSTQAMCESPIIVNEASAVSSSYTGTATGTATVNLQCGTLEPDLRLTKTAETVAVYLNEATPTGAARFTITVNNAGTAPATTVVLTDPLPQPESGDFANPNPSNLPDLLAWSIDSGGNGSSCAIANQTLTCNFGTLDVNATRTVTVSAPVTLAAFTNATQVYGIRSPQLIINTATVAAANETPTSNNSDTDQVDVFFPSSYETPTCYSPVLFYENKFDGNEFGTATWANNRLTTSPAMAGYTQETFLGEYGNEQLNFGFTAPDITAVDEAHNFVKVTFDLYILRSWDGQANALYGSDLWRMLMIGANQEQSLLLEYSFSNFNDTPDQIENSRQSYPFPYQWNLTTEGRSGAKAINALSYEFRGVVRNTTYEISYYLPRTVDPVSLGFSASGLQVIDDESWGIDNMKVEMCVLDPQLIMTSKLYIPLITGSH